MLGGYHVDSQVSILMRPTQQFTTVSRRSLTVNEGVKVISKNNVQNVKNLIFVSRSNRLSQPNGSVSCRSKPNACAVIGRIFAKGGRNASYIGSKTQ